MTGSEGKSKYSMYHVVPGILVLSAMILFAIWERGGYQTNEIDQSSQTSELKPKLQHKKKQPTMAATKGHDLNGSTSSSSFAPSEKLKKPNHEKVPSAGEDTNQKEKFLRFFETKGAGPWQVAINDKGEVFRVLGGKVPNVGRSKEDFLLFMEDLAPTLGVPIDQVNQVVQEDRTRELYIYDSIQHIAGFEVYGGWYRILSRQDTNEGIIFNNSIKKVDSDLKTNYELSLSAAQDLVRAHYGKKFTSFVSFKGPMVWANSAPHQLAYQFNIQLTDDTREVIFGIQSKSVVHSHTTVFH